MVWVCFPLIPPFLLMYGCWYVGNVEVTCYSCYKKKGERSAYIPILFGCFLGLPCDFVDWICCRLEMNSKDAVSDK